MKTSKIIDLNLPGNFFMKGALLIMVCLFLFPEPVNGAGFEEVLTQDSIKISYKWRKYQRFKKNSPEVLVLKLENLRKTRVTVSFRVLFHWEGMLHSRSNNKEYCMKPGQKIKGKRWELVFYSSELSEEDYHNPFFAWYVDELHVEENADCTPGLELQLAPAYPDRPNTTIEPINK